MELYRLEVGNVHGVSPGNIVGAIANEAEIDSGHIGRIEIFEDYSTVQLPEGMPKELFKHLKKVWVSGQRLQISRMGKDEKPPARAGGKPRGGEADSGRAAPAPRGKDKDKGKGKRKDNKATVVAEGK